VEGDTLVSCKCSITDMHLCVVPVSLPQPILSEWSAPVEDTCLPQYRCLSGSGHLIRPVPCEMRAGNAGDALQHPPSEGGRKEEVAGSAPCNWTFLPESRRMLIRLSTKWESNGFQPATHDGWLRLK
jgi:hypothetical protein